MQNQTYTLLILLFEPVKILVVGCSHATILLPITAGQLAQLLFLQRPLAALHCTLNTSFPPTFLLFHQIFSPWQGFCRYLEESFGNLKERGVVIGYDARAHPPSGGGSKRFASLATAVFISQGVPVHLFSDITPTPFVVITQISFMSSFGCLGFFWSCSHAHRWCNTLKRIIY